MNKIPLKIMRMNPDNDLPLPAYESDGSSGLDIRADVNEPVLLNPGDIKRVPTGFAISVPGGYEVQVRPRSGLALKYGIGLVNSPGTIDSDYRGEVMVGLINLGKDAYTISRGDRIAQMIVKQVYQARLKIVEKLDETDRNAGGFGHTG